MAQNEKEHFTRWLHLENGRPVIRNLHRLEIQTHSGRLHILTGDRLPAALLTSAGHGYRGAHVGQILLRAEKLPPPRATKTFVNHKLADEEPWPNNQGAWPNWRDAVQWLLGMLFVLFWNFLTTATRYM